jgi:hypothetical protein
MPLGRFRGIEMGQITVKVWGEDCDLSIYQKSKSVWIATGTYNGKSHQYQGRTETQAASAWQDAVRYHNN